MPFLFAVGVHFATVASFLKRERAETIGLAQEARQEARQQTERAEHLTKEQDWAICERAQKGVRSRAYRPGRYQSLEETIYFFDNWYLRSMETALLGNGDGE